MSNRVIKPNPELEALTQEMVDLRVRRVILSDAPAPDVVEIDRIHERLAVIERLIAEQHRRP